MQLVYHRQNCARLSLICFLKSNDIWYDGGNQFYWKWNFTGIKKAEVTWHWYRWQTQSLFRKLTTHGRSWKLYSECKELMLGIPPYWNPNRIFFQSSQASFTLCRINRKSGLKDLKQTKQFIRHTELSRRYRKYVTQNLTSRSLFIISHWFDHLFVKLCNLHEIFNTMYTKLLLKYNIFSGKLPPFIKILTYKNQ